MLKATNQLNSLEVPRAIQVNNNDVVTRMQRVCGVRNDGGLAIYLGVSSSAVSSWRKAKNPPFRACFEVVKRKDVTMEWLLLGELGLLPSDENLNQDKSNELDAPRLISQEVFVNSFVEFIDVACKVKMLIKPDDVNPKELSRLALGLYESLYNTDS